MTRMAILGAGRVGTTLAIALSRAGHGVTHVVSRQRATAERAVELAGAGQPGDRIADALDCDLAWLTVPDDQLSAVAGALADAGPPDGWSAIHTSGVCSSAVLAPLADRGVRCGSAHPLQTFADPDDALDNLPGTTWACEGHPDLVPVLEGVIRDLGGTPLAIRAEQKVLYHAGAVMACNYLVALTAVAVRLLEAAEIDPDDGLAALLPLIRGTLSNLSSVGLPDSLTGPISRGDARTIEAHLAALAGGTGEDVSSLYRLLGRESVALALAHGGIDEDRAAALLELLRAP